MTNRNMETMKADVEIANERARGALEITLCFQENGQNCQTELAANETASSAFPDGFDKFLDIESDKGRWSLLTDVLGFTK